MTCKVSGLQQVVPVAISTFCPLHCNPPPPPPLSQNLCPPPFPGPRHILLALLLPPQVLPFLSICSTFCCRQFANDIEGVLEMLPHKEGDVLALRYGLFNGEPKSLNDSAKLLKMSAEGVRKSELSAFRCVTVHLTPVSQPKRKTHVLMVSSLACLARSAYCIWVCSKHAKHCYI